MADLLIVDDNPDIAELVLLLLEGEGQTVRFARNGVEGLRALDERLPEAVLLDLEMPVLDGWGMAERMFLQNMGREFIPLILMSASPSLPHIARRIGTPYALAKPFDPDQLLLLIERALCEGHFPRPPISPLTLAEPNGLGQA